MRVRRIIAHSFGPLAGHILELADGLTVIHGPNESAKSTWHAAVTAALCGLRRGPRDEEFERFRPWDRPDIWEVSAEIMLADGRRIEMRHDLEGRVACYAKDLDIGRDYSGEITGSERGEVPDASRWLGLERRTFRATASVAQGQLTAVTSRNDALREHVQRAAATAGADETAAVALGRLEAYQREHVGADRVNAARPLRLAINETRKAAEQLAVAQRDHTAYEQRAVAARRLREEADALHRRVRGREAAVAQADAAALKARVAEATELSSLLSTSPPFSPGAVSTAARDVAAAVAAWRSLPTAVARDPGPVNADLAGRLRTAESTVAARQRAGRRAIALAAFGVALIVGGAAAIAASMAVVGATLAVSGAVLSLLAISSKHGPIRGASALAPALAELERARADQATQEWSAAARHRVGDQVLAAAGIVGVSGASVEDVLPGLVEWLAADPARAEERSRVRESLVHLDHVLGGLGLAELVRRADEAAHRAERAAEGLPADALELGSEEESAVRRAYEDAAQRAAAAEASLQVFAASATPVAEAEERVAAAAAELERVRDLDRILGLTRAYLARAQDRIYRDIAPRLALSVGRDLAAVTGGRYTDVIVDPGTLTVQVRAEGGRLREAGGLSYGTAEQVYLLLRVALAEHLVRRGESCPLLLDDVTVHADGQRTIQVLELLLRVAERHQVVLFSQQDQVRDWAQQRLTRPRHALRYLAPVRPA